MTTVRALLGAYCLGAFAACSSTPPTHYYAFPLPAAVAPASPPSASITVGPVTIPEMLDRPQMVVWGGNNEVEILEQSRWAEPLPAGIADVLAAYLRAALPQIRIGVSSDVTMANADPRVLVDVVRFAGQPGGSSTLEAHWAVVWRDTHRAHLTGTFQRQEATRRPGYDGLVDAQSRLLGALAADIASALKTAG